MKIIQTPKLSYDDVMLKPRYSSIPSRLDPKITLETKILPGMILKHPIVSANMDTVTEFDMATTISQLGGLGIIHRFMDPKDQASQLRKPFLDHRIGCIGVGDKGLERLGQITQFAHLDGVLIDIAHGDSIVCIKQIHQVKKYYAHLPIIAGNVATPEGAQRLIDAGADCIKIGIGPGSLCTTRVQTGNGIPQFSAVVACAEVVRKFGKTCIADGGIRSSGDIAKALAGGAHAVMVGSLFAGTQEAPGEIHLDTVGNSGMYKIYRGMASKAAQMNWKGSARSVEGETARVPFKGSVKPLYEDLIHGILSAMTYQNAFSLEELYTHAEFIVQTSAGSKEALPHGLYR